MSVTKFLLLTALAVAATAAPQGELPNSYLPPPTTPPPTPPPEEYLPPNPEYLPPPPEEEYLPPPPEKEYLPPPPEKEYLPPPPEEEYLPPSAGDGTAKDDGEVSEGDVGGIADGSVDNSLTEDAGQDAGKDDGQGGGQSGGTSNFDDGQYHPEQYNSGKYDPNANKFRGDDGQYHPEEINFPAIEDFEFAYAVKDKDSGNDFAVNESNKGGAYKVLLPDGRTQIVQYIIDSRGIYRSKITYLQPDGSQ